MMWLHKLIKKRVEKKVEERIADMFSRTPEQEVMYQEQLRIRDELGFVRGDDTQNWLRMHQILLDHETRLKHAETRDAK